MTVTLEGTQLVVSDDLFQALCAAYNTSNLARLLLDSYIAEHLVTTKAINYLDAAPGGQVSSLSATRQRTMRENTYEDDLAPSDFFVAPGRQEGNAGRVLRKVLVPEAFGEGVTVPFRHAPERHITPKPRVTDADLEVLTVHLQATFKPPVFHIVSGEAIRYWYYEETSTEQESSLLHASCMRYAGCWHATRFYAVNPHVIGLLITRDAAGKLTGRALLWKGPQGILMDRVYGTNQTQNAFRRFAQARGWFFRTSDKTGYAEATISFFAVPLQQLPPHLTLPYLDTMRVVRSHASGDLATSYDSGGRLITEGDLERESFRTSLRSPVRNPICHAAVVLRTGNPPADHPLSRPHGRRPEESVRHATVDWMTDFSWLEPWPEDLFTHSPAWTLDTWGSEAENDVANALTFPKRRTEAQNIALPPPPSPTDRPPTRLMQEIDADAFREHVRVLEQALVTARRATAEAPAAP